RATQDATQDASRACRLASLSADFGNAIERRGRPRRAQPGWRSPPGLELAAQYASRACRGARWHFQDLPPVICAPADLQHLPAPEIASRRSLAGPFQLQRGAQSLGHAVPDVAAR